MVSQPQASSTQTQVSPEAESKPNAQLNFDQIARESKEKISEDLKSTPKRETVSTPPVDSAANPGVGGAPGAPVAVYTPTIVKNVVAQGTQTICNSRAQLTGLETWKVSSEESEQVGQSIDHLLQVWFPDMGGGNPKVQTALTAIMTVGYVFGTRVLAEQKVRAAVAKKLAEEKRRQKNADQPEKQPTQFTETQPTSVEGMQ